MWSYGAEGDVPSRLSIRWFHAADRPRGAFSDFGLRAFFGLRVTVFGFQGRRQAFALYRPAFRAALRAPFALELVSRRANSDAHEVCDLQRDLSGMED